MPSFLDLSRNFPFSIYCRRIVPAHEIRAVPVSGFQVPVPALLEMGAPTTPTKAMIFFFGPFSLDIFIFVGLEYIEA